MQNVDKSISNIRSFQIAKNSLLLPSPDLTKKVSTSFLSKFFGGYIRFRSLFTKLKITTEPNKQLRSGFPYVMPYSIYFALIKKNSVLPVYFPQKTYFKSCNARREKLMVFHDLKILSRLGFEFTELSKISQND